MKSKVVSMIIVSVLSCIMLAGCGHEHEWKEATCTEPKTCATCGEIEGEPLEHSWVEATCTEPKTCATCGEVEGEVLEHSWVEVTCTEPKTCSLCGLTEGEALGHTLSEATYQQAATCTVCGATEGEPITPFFEANAIPGQFIEVGKEYEYTVDCAEVEGKKTVGKLSVTNYQTIVSDDTHEAKEGYEWKIADIQVVFSDENANAYRPYPQSFVNDYYINSCGEEYNGQWGEGKKFVTFTVNWNGQDYTECKRIWHSEWLDWDGNTWTLVEEVAVLVPVGYDGFIITYYDKDGKKLVLDDNGVVVYPNENVLNFRFQ